MEDHDQPLPVIMDLLDVELRTHTPTVSGIVLTIHPYYTPQPSGHPAVISVLCSVVVMMALNFRSKYPLHLSNEKVGARGPMAS